jgi:UDP-N-acetylglucosamine diphosphorylase/glucosamine-1-phosphate N-acetyltransferase
MMNVFLFDDALREQLYPFTRTRAAADIRCGILTLRERWEKLLAVDQTGTLTAAYMQPLYAETGLPVSGESVLLLNGRAFATKALAAQCAGLALGEKISNEAGVVLAAHVEVLPEWQNLKMVLDAASPVEAVEAPRFLNRVWDIFSSNGEWIGADFLLLTAGRNSVKIGEGVTVSGAENVFLEAGAVVRPGTVLNATGGPIYLGKNAEIMEGSLVRGPFALCAGSTVKMGAKIYGDTTIGPGSKVGGEVSNAVFFANSNKGHDGFVGNCVIGEWCNLGADTNASNLKNNYDGVKIHDDATGRRLATGLTFCGLLMADHSKCGINTMFNTGTVMGVSCNIYGGEFPPAYIPSFSWGGAAGLKTYAFDKAIDTAKRMKARRSMAVSPAEEAMLRHIFEETAVAREKAATAPSPL